MRSAKLRLQNVRTYLRYFTIVCLQKQKLYCHILHLEIETNAWENSISEIM